MLNNFTELISRVADLKKGLTTKDFARRLGMTQQTVDLYLKGERKPSLEFIYNICSSFGVSADWLLGLSEASSVGRGGTRVTASGGSVVAVGGGNATASNCRDCPILLDFIKRRSGGGK